MKNIIKNISIKLLKTLVNTLGQLSGGISLASKEGFTSGKMLDYIYKNEPSGKFLIGKFLDKIYLSHRGWQDVRERKKNLTSCTIEAVNLVLEKKDEAIICDIASGPARYIIEVLEHFRGKNVSAQLRDIDPRWLEDAKEKAEQAKVKVDIAVKDALKKEDFKFEKRPDIFVASGFYDWFDDVEILKKSMGLVYESLSTGGLFVFSLQTGHFDITLVNEIFKDFNNNQLKMIVWDSKTVDSVLKEIGFKTLKILSDAQNRYPVYLVQK